MVKVKRQIVPSHIAKKVTYNGKNTNKYIIIHETANESIGANAQTHANLQSRGFSASWHYSVGSDGIYQSFEDNAQCWHAGSPSYNKQSIGIEICVNADGNYNKAVDNAIELTKHLMKKHNISVMNVLPHQKTSTWSKECPRYLLRGRYIAWNEFINRLKGDSKVSVSKPTNAPSKPKQPSSTPKTGSIVDYLNSKGINSSYSNRKKLASQHGISNYKGTASQNVALLNKLQGTSNKVSKPSAKKANIKVDGYWGAATTRALQRYYGTPQDGIISKPSLVIRKLQGTLKVKADGYVGPVTIRAMQRRFKTPVDGVISKPSVLVRELQRRLNRGKL